MAYLKTKPYSLGCDEGQRLKSMGALISVKATSQQTSGAFNLFDVACPPGFTTPLHIHYCEDVVIFILEGTLTFFWGDEEKEAVPGSYFFQPRGTPHGFRVKGSTPARILYMTIPAGFDRFILERFTHERFILEHELAAPKSEHEQDAARYKIEILGPLPE